MSSSEKRGTESLYDINESARFYDERYEKGYMEQWPEDVKRKISEVVGGLNLPDEGSALDFGCGNGALTKILRDSLPPGWKVYGTDLSSVAVANAASKIGDCVFFAAGDKEFQGMKFDFLFTHHVLEHVYDMDQVLREMDGLMAERASMLHILPCGNEGSFEHSLCKKRKDGINPELENRFYYEDEGHVRRLTTERAAESFRRIGFEMTNCYYSNQLCGAFNWIARQDAEFIKNLTDGRMAAGGGAALSLLFLRIIFMSLRALLEPARIYKEKTRKSARTPRDIAILAIVAPFAIFSVPIDALISMMSAREWKTRRGDRRGSEMFLCFERKR